MLVPFILLLSAWGISCDPFECMEKGRANCDLILLPKDFPETVEELRTICSNVNKFTTCMTQVYESCEYGEDFLNKLRKRLDFMSSVCDEDHPIFKDYGTQNPGQQLSKDPECDCEWRYLKHYEAKGCRPVYEEKPDVGKSECTCPSRFDCSQADEVISDEKACVYKKHVYPLGSEIPTTNTCQRCSCTTDYFTQAATITCITNGCLYVYLHTTVPEGCYYVYEEKECCPTVECPAKEKENTYRVPICEYKGKMYYEGEQIFPDENPCLTCLCNSNWTGINSTTCRQYDCMLERHSRKLKQGCIPIYHEKTCCPVEYHCSDYDFEFKVNRGSNFKSEDDEDEMCHFEGRSYHIGHVLDIKHPTHCVTCTCKTPPDFTCIHSSCPSPPNGDYTHCRAVYKPNACCPDYKCHEKKDYGTQNPGQQLSKDPECDCEWRYLKHYEAKGCRPVYEEKPGIGKSECTCPSRFDCSQADEVITDERACVYKKHVYQVGSKIPMTNACHQCSCTTDYLTQAATITCITTECLSVYSHAPLPKGCHYVYKEKECCPTVECPAKEKENTNKASCFLRLWKSLLKKYLLINQGSGKVDLRCGKGEKPKLKVPICEYKGKMYYEGERIRPDEDLCLTCLCNSNWTGINSTTCRQYDCMLERDSRKLKHGCIPIYHEKTCCPIEYHCSDYDFEFKVNRGSNFKSEDDEDEMCHFEGRSYPIGHVLDIKHPTHCVTCTCKTPPDFTCIHSSCPPPPNGDYTNCRSVRKPNTCCADYKCHEKEDPWEIDSWK